MITVRFILTEETSLVLPLVEGNFFDENNIPSSTHIFNVQNNAIVQDYIIKNVKYSDLSPNSLNNIQINKIPTEIKSEFKVYKHKK